MQVGVDAAGDARTDAVADAGAAIDQGGAPDASGDARAEMTVDVASEAGLGDVGLDTGAGAHADADADEAGADAGAGEGGDGAATDAGRPEILVVATYLGGISSLRIDPTSGGLTPVTSSLDSGGQLYGVVAHPSGDFVYAADLRGRIYGYRVNRADGSLAALANLPLMIGGQAITPAIDPQGRLLYVTNSGDNSLYAYHIAADSGALTPVTNSPFVLGANPTSVCFHPSGAFAYVSSAALSTTTQGGIRVFSVEPTSGVPTEIAGSPFATSVFGGALAVHPNGNFLFDSSFGVHVLAIDPTTRGVHELSDSPRPGAQSDNQAVDIAVDPLAQYFYASSNQGTVTAYRLDATTAAFGPVEGSPYNLTGMPYSVAIDPTGRFAYVGNDDADQVWAFTIERASGKLQSIGPPVTVHGLQPEMVFIGP
jgi:6-phosphogluconolactonase (cycloisomerase 2 family)